MKVIFQGAIAIFLSVFALTSTHAQESANLPFVLSGVIQLNTNSSTIRVVQGVVLSQDEKKAVDTFKSSAASQYPDYKLIDVLVNRVDELYKPADAITKETTVSPKKKSLVDI